MENQAKYKAIADAMADSILNHREAVDGLFAKYGEDSTLKTPMEVLKYIENRVRVDKTFNEDFAKLLLAIYGSGNNVDVRRLPPNHSLYRGFIGDIMNMVGSLAEMTGGIVTATNKGAQGVAQTQAQAALAEAQAQIEIAKNEAQKSIQKNKTIIIAGAIAGVVIIGTVGLVLYFKYRK